MRTQTNLVPYCMRCIQDYFSQSILELISFICAEWSREVREDVKIYHIDSIRTQIFKCSSLLRDECSSCWKKGMWVSVVHWSDSMMSHSLMLPHNAGFLLCKKYFRQIISSTLPLFLANWICLKHACQLLIRFRRIRKIACKKALKTDSNYIDRAFARWRNSDFEVSEKKNINNSFVFMRGEFLYNFYHHSRAICWHFVYLRLFLSFERFVGDVQEEVKKNQIEELLALIMMKM